MKPQPSTAQGEFSEPIFPELHSSNAQEGPSEPMEPTFVDDDELLPLTPFVTRGHSPEDLCREFESDMESFSSLEENPNADNH